MRIKLEVDSLPAYDIVEPELLTMTIPGASLTSDALPAGYCNALLCASCPCYAAGALPDLIGPPMLILAQPNGAATATGSVMPSQSFKQLREADAPPHLALQLSGGERWSESLQDELSARSWIEPAPLDDTGHGAVVAAILASLRSDTSQPDGWNEAMHGGAMAGRAHASLALTSNETATLAFEWGAFAGYAPRAPETVHVSLPGAALESGAPLPLIGAFVITIEPGGSRLSGSLLATPTEEALRSLDPVTLQLSLSGGDTWLPTVGMDHPVTAELLASCTSAHANLYSDWAGGWGAIVQPSLGMFNLDRASDSLVVLTLPQQPRYELEAPETISCAVPSAATASGHGYAVRGVVAVRASAGRARLNGSLLLDRQERAVRGGDKGLVIALSGDTWSMALRRPGWQTSEAAEETAALVADAIVVAPTVAHGWGASVRPLLTAATMTLLDNATLAIDLPVAALYQLYGVQETLTVQVVSPPTLTRQTRPLAYALTLPSLTPLTPPSSPCGRACSCPRRC